MIRITLLTFAILLTSIGYSQNNNNATPSQYTTQLNNVNIYRNHSLKSFIVDFYEQDFKAVTVKITDSSGGIISEYELGDVQSGTFAEINMPSSFSKSDLVITVNSEGKSYVEKVDIFATR